MHAIAGKVASIFLLAGFASYYFSALFLGRCKPARAAWFVLSVSGSLLFASYYAGGARSTALAAFSGLVLGPIVTFLISLKCHDGSRWTRLETVCTVAAIVSVVPWWLLRDPMTTMLINLAIDSLAMPSLWKHVWDKPKSEDKLAWSLWFIGNAVNAFAIEEWTFRIAIFPIYFLAVNGVTVAILFTRLRVSRWRS
jgi:hypothetical protein